MPALPFRERVKFWNSFFYEAWAHARSLSKSLGESTREKDFNPLGGMPDNERRSVLLLLTFCVLAIEARANHLIEKLVEKGRIGKSEAEAIVRLLPKEKWFLLPKISGSKRRLRDNKFPHQAIAEICDCRNLLFHVNFKRLSEHLPSARKMLSLFKGFVCAMEDMNVALGFKRKSRKKVLDIARF